MFGDSLFDFCSSANRNGRLIYNNLFGLNHSTSMEVELNNRLSHSNLDPSRSSDLGSMLEYEVKLNYTIPDIFKSYWDYSTSLSSARRSFE